MKRQFVKETVINKQTLLFYRLESDSCILMVERSGMSWGLFLTLEGAETRRTCGGYRIFRIDWTKRRSRVTCCVCGRYF